MDVVGHVGALRLRRGAVRGHVEVSRHLAGRKVRKRESGARKRIKGAPATHLVGQLTCADCAHARI